MPIIYPISKPAQEEQEIEGNHNSWCGTHTTTVPELTG
jgi:hypothetical protein